MGYKQNQAVITAIGVAMLILIVAETTTATKAAPFTLPNGTDANSLLQVWVQQPDTSGLWVPWVRMKLDPQNEENSPRALHEPNNAREVDESTYYDYNVTEWDELPPSNNLPTITSSEGELNLCMHGHLVPEFFLVGVVKSGSTTFAGNMRQSPEVLFPKKRKCTERRNGYCYNGTTKEGHFFDFHVSNGSQFMAQSFPACRTDMRLVATDESPRYLVDPDVPNVIANWYGPELQQRLKFVIILREPVARFHSDFYHATASDWCADYGKKNFSTLVRKIVLEDGWWQHLIGGNKNCSDRLEASLYKGQLTRWFSIFNPEQFMIVPFHLAVGPSGANLIRKMWDILNVVHGQPWPNSQLNQHYHPPLANDISMDLLDQFRSLLFAENGPLPLSSFFIDHPGAHLYGLPRASMMDRTAIFDWLSENW